MVCALNCENDGTCRVPDALGSAGGMYCACQTGFAGQNCEIPYVTCPDGITECSHGGECIEIEEHAGDEEVAQEDEHGTKSYGCFCPDHRDGDFCEITSTDSDYSRPTEHPDFASSSDEDPSSSNTGDEGIWDPNSQRKVAIAILVVVIAVAFAVVCCCYCRTRKRKSKNPGAKIGSNRGTGDVHGCDGGLPETEGEREII